MPLPHDFATVRKLARELGEIEETTTHGSPAIKANGKLLAWIPANKPVEPHTLAVHIPLEARAELLASAPETYYLIDHYNDYPAVLVRLNRIHPDALKDLLRMSWTFVTAKPAKRPPKRTR